MSATAEISKKSISSKLARLIYSNSKDNITMEKMAQQLNPATDKLRTDSPKGDPDGDNFGNNVMVGVWKQNLENGVASYVRDASKTLEWGYWSQRHEIPPKSCKKRIVMLGESVARGYLYDPYYCPAEVLEKTLNDSRFVDCEVIDLARTNLELWGLMEVSSQCVHLQPDAIVIFAGNNWLYSIKKNFGRSDFSSMISTLEKDGLKGLQNFLVDKLKALIAKLLSQLSDIAKAQGNIPIIFLIPEFNLIDWKSTLNEKILSSLPNQDLREWVASKDEAEKALASGDFEKACALGERLIEIDISHPSGYEILATAKMKQGLHAEARKHFESARDTSVFSRAFSKPRMHAVIRETLLEEAEKYQLTTVDLPAIFTEQEGGALPGRKLFLDYCHLSEEGIQLAMAAAARQLVSSLCNKEVGLQDFRPEKFRADNDVKAIAYLCAAVHNAHYGQTHDVLDYLCETAVQASPVAIEIMTNFVDFASRRISTTLCKSHEKLVEKEWINQYGGGIGFLHKREQKIMDLALVDAMTGALKRAGVDLTQEVKSLRKREHSVNRRKVNLLESFYNITAYDTFPGLTPGYYQSRDVESAFYFVADPGAPVDLKITYRTPHRNSTGDKVKFEINGLQIADFSASDRWVTHTFTIPAAGLVDGINKLIVTWSTAFEFGTNGKSVEISEDYVLSKLFQVYGEIAQFTATAASGPNQ